MSDCVKEAPEACDEILVSVCVLLLWCLRIEGVFTI